MTAFGNATPNRSGVTRPFFDKHYFVEGVRSAVASGSLFRLRRRISEEQSRAPQE